MVLLLAIWRRIGKSNKTAEKLDVLREDMASQLRQNREESGRSVQTSVKTMGEMLLTAQGEANKANLAAMETIRKSVQEGMHELRAENSRQLEQMRGTVDEKLQKTLDERISQSFKMVNERLEQVYKGLGEMQSLASGVGDLKKVLSNVKTRGVLGEIQLGAILEEILSPDQYIANAVTKPGSKNFVEFAVKMPGNGEDTVLLPVDAKFPADAYSQLMDAYDSGDPALIEATGKTLETRIRQFAKDIRDKYIDPPHTTDFGIMFLPFEGLYAEVVRRGMVEPLQRDYHVNVAGPTTMAALLNSLQMGFRTLAIQKRSGEVWKVLGAVKTEFDKFGDVITVAQSRLEQANAELDKLVGVRTRQIQRKLSAVATLSDTDARQILETEAGELTDPQA
ncbi:MAG: DNA recombination protein RmuC [Clostridia bacterium]|nr:DNA recombination protein RmuC [Clostridia bacterium]